MFRLVPYQGLCSVEVAAKELYMIRKVYSWGTVAAQLLFLFSCSDEHSSKIGRANQSSSQQDAAEITSTGSLAVDPFKPELFLSELESLSDNQAMMRNSVNDVEITGRRLSRENSASLASEPGYDIRSRVIIEAKVVNSNNKILLYPYLISKNNNASDVNEKLLNLEVGQLVRVEGIDLKIADELRGFARILRVDLIENNGFAPL